MKIERINEDKIKITFNIDDLEEKNIDLYSFMHNTPETQDLFFDILDEAERECGFNVDNSMICVEASTSGSGNFSLIVTKTNEKISPPTFTNDKAKKNIKLKRKTIPLDAKENIYQFEIFEDVCNFASIIDTKEIINDTLYVLNGNYYLKTYCMPFHNILEYATLSIDSNLLEAKLNEYGKLIIEKNALQTIKKYFLKKKK